MRLLVRFWPEEHLNGRELPWVTLLSCASQEEVAMVTQAMQEPGKPWEMWEVLTEKEDGAWEVLASKEKIS